MVAAFLAVAVGIVPASVAVAAPGELDPSFGDGGKVRTPIDNTSHAYAIGRQTSGKLIAAGCSAGSEPGSQAPQFAIARYTAGGILDPSFGSDGVAFVPFPNSSSSGCVEDLAIRPDNSIVLAGSADSGPDQDFAVAQLTPDGQLDSSFGTDGRVRLHPGRAEGSASATAIALDPAGRAVIAGHAWTGSRVNGHDVPVFAAVRIESDGTLDTNFGEVLMEMTETTPAGTLPISALADIARYPDGRIVLAGTAYDYWQDSQPGLQARLAIVRLDSDGELDPSFSGDGKLVTPIRDVTDSASGNAVALTPDGRITVGGWLNQQPLVARFEQGGEPDLAFGSEGSTLLSELGGGEPEGDLAAVQAMRYQSDGKLVTAGVADPPTGLELPRFGVARLDVNGEPDPSFGANGVVSGPPFALGDSWRTAYGYDLVLEPSGNLVVAGLESGEGPENFALARYQGDTPPPPPPLNYVALGDSYSSGFGVGDYEPGTHKDGDTYPANDCQRSEGAYGPIVSDTLEMPLVFKACSGAETHDLLHPRDDREDDPWGEIAQFDYLDSSVKLLTFSIGGNDVGFAEILESCVLDDPCSSNKEMTESVGKVFERLEGTRPTPTHINPYSKLFKEVRERAPIATLIAVGYPEFFLEKGGDRNDSPSGRCEGVRKVDQRWIVEQIRSLHKIIAQTAGRYDFVEFVDPSPGFDDGDGHKLCSGGEEWFFPALGLPFLHPGRFHPTEEGQNAIAQAVLDKLKDDSEPAGNEFMIASDETASHQFAVPAGKARLTVSTEWPGSDVVMSVTSPSGQEHTRNDPGPGVEHENGPTWEQLEIPNPEPGEWLVELYGADVPAEGEPVSLSTVVEDPPNIPPTARIGQHREGDRLIVDAGDSTDADGQISSYDWYLSSATSESTSTGPTLPLPAEQPERLTVTVVVTDDEGAADFAAVVLAATTSPEPAASPPAVAPVLAAPAIAIDRRPPRLRGIRLQVRAPRGWRNTRVIRTRRYYRGRAKRITRGVRLVFWLSENARVAFRVRATGMKKRWQRRRDWRLRSGRHRFSITKLMRRARPGRYRLTLVARNRFGTARAYRRNFFITQD